MIISLWDCFDTGFREIKFRGSASGLGSEFYDSKKSNNSVSKHLLALLIANKLNTDDGGKDKIIIVKPNIYFFKNTGSDYIKIFKLGSG